MITTWMVPLLWIAVIASVGSALWGVVFLRAYRSTWVLGDLTVAAFALFWLFKDNLSDAAVQTVLLLLLAWVPVLMIINWRTRRSLRRTGK